MFWKLDLFPSSGEGGGGHLLCWVPWEELSNTGRWTKSENPVILSVIHHCQNPLESTVKMDCKGRVLPTLLKVGTNQEFAWRDRGKV
jgi:hypothetical protein